MRSNTLDYFYQLGRTLIVTFFHCTLKMILVHMNMISALINKVTQLPCSLVTTGDV